MPVIEYRPSQPDRVFLDANVLHSAAYKFDAIVRRIWTLPDVQLITSTLAVTEAHRNLQSERQRSDLDMFLASVQIEDYVMQPNDPRIIDLKLATKDQPILLAAIDLGASHLLTGDKKHFGRLYGQQIHGVLILPTSNYP
ncbi:MAG: hypothetical protein ACRDJH_12655 [Thermomicrobiales bacterium]